jgi:hypothetical protein
MISWAAPARMLFIAAAGPILLLGLYMCPAADDFGYWNLARTSGSPYGFASQMYATWSGRLTTHFLNGVVFSWPDLFPVFAIVPPLAFALLPLGFIASLESFDQRLSTSASAALAACSLAALFIGLSPYLSQCVFWLTGGLVYVIPLLASLVWLGALTRPVWPNRLGPTALVLAALPLSLAGEQTSAALLAAAAMFAVVSRKLSPRFALALTLMIVGSVILVTAPGNAARATNGQRGLTSAPGALLSNYGWVMADTWVRFVGPVVAGVVLGSMAAVLRGATVVNRRGIVNWTLVMLAAAVGATLPLAAVPDFASSRTAFVPGAFLLAASAGGSFVLVEALLGPNRATARTIGIGLATCLLAAYVGLATRGWAEARGLRPQLVARWATLARATNSGTDVTVPALSGDDPIYFFAPDLAADPSYWVNAYTAEFFGLKSVRAAER